MIKTAFPLPAYLSSPVYWDIWAIVGLCTHHSEMASAWLLMLITVFYASMCVCMYLCMHVCMRYVTPSQHAPYYYQAHVTPLGSFNQRHCPCSWQCTYLKFWNYDKHNRPIHIHTLQSTSVKFSNHGNGLYGAQCSLPDCPGCVNKYHTMLFNMPAFQQIPWPIQSGTSSNVYYI